MILLKKRSGFRIVRNDDDPRREALRVRFLKEFEDVETDDRIVGSLFSERSESVRADDEHAGGPSSDFSIASNTGRKSVPPRLLMLKSSAMSDVSNASHRKTR